MNKSEFRTETGTQKIVQGQPEAIEIVLEGKVVAGDIIGRTAQGLLNKYDETTYNIVYGVAYNDSEEINSKNRVTAIIGGGVYENFINFTQGKEYLEKILLRDKGIYTK